MAAAGATREPIRGSRRDKPMKSVLKFWPLILAAVAVWGWTTAWAGSPAQPGQDIDELFISLDANHDGKVSEQEFLASWKDRLEAAKRFKKLDKNHDGFIVKQELAVEKEKIGDR